MDTSEIHVVLDRWSEFPPGWNFLPIPCLHPSSPASYQQGFRYPLKDKGTTFLFLGLESPSVRMSPSQEKTGAQLCVHVV